MAAPRGVMNDSDVNRELARPPPPPFIPYLNSIPLTLPNTPPFPPTLPPPLPPWPRQPGAPAVPTWTAGCGASASWLCPAERRPPRSTPAQAYYEPWCWHPGREPGVHWLQKAPAHVRPAAYAQEPPPPPDSFSPLLDVCPRSPSAGRGRERVLARDKDARAPGPCRPARCGSRAVLGPPDRPPRACPGCQPQIGGSLSSQTLAPAPRRPVPARPPRGPQRSRGLAAPPPPRPSPPRPPRPPPPRCPQRPPRCKAVAKPVTTPWFRDIDCGTEFCDSGPREDRPAPAAAIVVCQKPSFVGHRP